MEGSGAALGGGLGWMLEKVDETGDVFICVPTCGESRGPRDGAIVGCAAGARISSSDLALAGGGRAGVLRSLPMKIDGERVGGWRSSPLDSMVDEAGVWKSSFSLLTAGAGGA